MELPFGKRVMCGNYYVLKHTKSLTKKEIEKLRNAQNIPNDVRKYLTRGVLPVITVSTVTDSWRIEFVAGMGVYEAIAEIPIAMDSEGNYTYYGAGYTNLGNIINGWYAYTSTVGDEEYQADVIKAMQSYLSRMAEKNKEPLPAEETKEVMDNEASKESASQTLKEMSEEVKAEAETRK